jgi:hypothetical protein
MERSTLIHVLLVVLGTYIGMAAGCYFLAEQPGDFLRNLRKVVQKLSGDSL